METRRFRLVAVTLLAALALVLAARSQAIAQPSNADPDAIQILGVQEDVDQSGKDQITLEVAVPPVVGRLAAVDTNFGVTDGGQLVDVSVSRVETPLATVIVLDTSGSMRGPALDAAKAAATSFILALPGDAKVGLISFGDTVVTHRSPTLDRDGLLAELDDLEATGEETILWDALVVAAELVSDTGQSSVVVLSDGDDTASAATPSDVVDQLGSGPGAAVLYAVAIESPDTNLVALEKTVGLVSGQFLATDDVDKLDSLYTDIAGRLVNRYRLRFTPAQQGTRSVVVSVAADGSVATARTTVGAGNPGGGPAGESSSGSNPGTGDPAPVLNIDDHPVLGAVITQPGSRIGGRTLLLVGLGSMFTALALLGLLLVRPQAQVRLDAAAGADRLGGISVRMGQAADRVISRHDRGRHLDARLEAADISLRPGEFFLAWTLTTLSGFLVVAAAGGLIAGVVVILGSIGITFLILGMRTRRLRDRFADQLTETMGIMASSLRAGQSLARSIELVALEASSPTADQFHRISFEIRVGRDLTDSIREAARRMDSSDLEWLAQAVDINRELGGDLTEILDNVAATIRERRTVSRQIDALSAEGRATGWVLLAMPIVLFLFGWWRTPATMATLVSEPTGRVLLAIAVTGMTVGHFWIRHLVKLKF